MTTQILESPAIKSDAKRSEYIRCFNEIGIDDIPLVGGKNASLGEMCRELAAKGVKVSNGFAITADAYRYVLRKGVSTRKSKRFLATSIHGKSRTFASAPSRCGRQSLVSNCLSTLEAEIIGAYSKLRGSDLHPTDVAVRSSATAEDLPDASFAGQQETYLNVQGGGKYEPKEENPMIGFCGASRCHNPRYQAGFRLECLAMKKVRDEMGLKNLKLMVPFCRTVEEGLRVQVCPVSRRARHRQNFAQS